MGTFKVKRTISGGAIEKLLSKASIRIASVCQMTSEPRQTASRDAAQQSLWDSRAVLAALLCALLWGANSVAVKFATEQIPPFCMAALRFGSACMVTGGWALAYRQRLRLCPGQVRMVPDQTV